jgi:hypothetical protein
VAPVGPVEPPPKKTSREIIPVNGSMYKESLADATGKSPNPIDTSLTVSDTLKLETNLSVDIFTAEVSLATLPKL